MDHHITGIDELKEVRECPYQVFVLLSSLLLVRLIDLFIIIFRICDDILHDIMYILVSELETIFLCQCNDVFIIEMEITIGKVVEVLEWSEVMHFCKVSLQ